jgi:hypothetical protein
MISRKLEGLIDEVRRQERQKELIAAVVTWMNAFSSFKQLRNRIGLPSDKLNQLRYGAILGSIKSTGKMLLVWVQAEGCDLKPAATTLATLHACVQELVDDDRVLDGGYIGADFSDFERQFCGS